MISDSERPSLESTWKWGVRMSRPSEEILSVARTLGRTAPFEETIFESREELLRDGTRLRFGCYVDVNEVRLRVELSEIFYAREGQGWGFPRFSH